MLAMADANGIVQASIPGLADRSRVPLDDCLKALDAFMQEDKWSRSKEYAGRRIVEVDGGWALLNHAKYRAVQDAEHRKEQSRLAMRRLRAERAGVSTVNTGDGRLTQAEAEAEATKKSPPAARVPPAVAGPKASKKCPAGFEVTPDMQEWCATEFPRLDWRAETEALRDYTFATSCTDWPGRWRNWMRKAGKQAPKGPGALTFKERDAVNAAARVHEMTGGILGKQATDIFSKEIFDADPTRLLG